MLSKRPMRFFTSPLLVPCCAHAKAGGLLRSRTVSGAIQQGCARVFDPKKDGAAAACAFQRARTGGGLGLAPLEPGTAKNSFWRNFRDIRLLGDSWANDVFTNDLPHASIVPVRWSWYEPPMPF